MGEMSVAHDIRHGLKANQQITADGLRQSHT
ncbi:MAG: transposase, partial [Pseudomonas sp.]